MTTLRRWLLLGVVLLAAAGSTVVVRDWWQARDNHVRWLTPVAACQLGQAPCVGSLENHQIRVTADRQAFSPEAPFALTVELSPSLQAAAAHDLWLQLEGVDMYMGISRYRLQPQPDGRYGLELRLPSCTMARMRWQGQIRVGAAEQRVLAYQFEFDAVQQ